MLYAHTGNNFSHPSTSQELADIFGTSDDEEDVGFPFGLNSALPIPKGFDDITLPGGNTNSLLGNTDSELFLAGFQPSPKVDSSSSEVKSSPQVEEVKKEPEVKPQDVVMETGDKNDDNKEEVEVNNDKNKEDDKKDITPSRSLIIILCTIIIIVALEANNLCGKRFFNVCIHKLKKKKGQYRLLPRNVCVCARSPVMCSACIIMVCFLCFPFSPRSY